MKRTEEEDRVADLMRMADVMARALEASALRIRQESQNFLRDGLRSGAVGVAADITREVATATGPAATYVWDIATEAAKLDVHRRELKATVSQ